MSYTDDMKRALQVAARKPENQKHLLTMEQKQALQQFVRVHGNRGWKQAARRLWARAIAYEVYESTVYALRNTHGPGWLQRARVDETGWLK